MLGFRKGSVKKAKEGLRKCLRNGCKEDLRKGSVRKALGREV